MEPKDFNKFQRANLRRYAQIVEPLINKRDKEIAKIEEHQKMVNTYQEQIDIVDALVKAMTGGYGVESIIKKVVTCTDKVDKKGNIVKKTDFVFIYPDTVIPPSTEDSNDNIQD